MAKKKPEKKERNLFEELKEGMDHLEKERNEFRIFAVIQFDKAGDVPDKENPEQMIPHYNFPGSILGYIKTTNKEAAFRIALSLESAADKDFQSFMVAEVDPTTVKQMKGQFFAQG